MTPDLLARFLQLPDETEYLEFKHNKDDPESIGEYISALSNSAALVDMSWGYLFWGIADRTHQVVGTDASPRERKVGNEPLENWLSRMLHPGVNFRFGEMTFEGRRVVWLEVQAASHTPVRFRDFEYVRVGQVTKKLRDHPEKERALWAKFAPDGLEKDIVQEFDSLPEAVATLDYEAYSRLSGNRFTNVPAIGERFQTERFLLQRPDGGCSITLLGAILFAKDLSDFPSLRRKAPRVILYRGSGRTEAIAEQEGQKGYAAGFEGLLRYLDRSLPRSEHIRNSLRVEDSVFPHLALRELVANALIHQDLTQRGAGPMVEVFDDRIEISNPGASLVDTVRMIDAPPRSRNEQLATFMRRAGICEERGSGVDKVIDACELAQLPAPEFKVVEGFTKVTMFAPRPLRSMSRADRIRACYQHAVLLWVSSQQMTNSSIRARFGITDKNAAQASRIIREAVERAGPVRQNSRPDSISGFSAGIYAALAGGSALK